MTGLSEANGIDMPYPARLAEADEQMIRTLTGCSVACAEALTARCTH